MQFLTVAVASLSLGSQVLAAPLSVTATVNGVTSELTNLPGQVLGSVETVVKRALVAASTLAGGVEALPLTPAAVTADATVVVGDAVSNVEAIAKRDSLILTIVSSVSTLKTSVESDLAVISSTVETDVTTSVVPLVQSSLVNVATSVNTTLSTIVTNVAGIALPLAVGEVESVISLVGDVENLVAEVKTVLTTLVDSVETEAVDMLTPEITAVMALVMPFVTPITAFAYSVAGTVVGTDSATQLLSAASSLTGVVTELLSPVEGVLSAL